MMAGILVVTACDAAHFALAEDLLASLCLIPNRTFRIGFVQLGDVAAPPAITDHVDEFRVASRNADAIRDGEGFAVAYLAIKARLPTLFPGYDVYVWLDGDTWVQHAEGIDHIVAGARMADICAHPQLDPNYWACRYPDFYSLRVYDRLFGAEVCARYAPYPMINAGVFGAMAASPLWDEWAALLVDIRSRLRDQRDRFFSDQIPLHHLIYSGALTLHPLRAVDNWLVQHCTPRVDTATGRLTAPSLPHEEINIIHLVGATKDQAYRLGEIETSLRFRDVRRHFAPSGESAQPG